MLKNSSAALYETYTAQMQKIADLRYATAVLQWDQETYLPVKGAARRGQQVATLSETAHQFFTSNELGNLLEELLQKDDLSPKQKKNVTLTWEDYSKQ